MLRNWFAASDFHDAFAVPLAAPGLSPTELFLRAARATPHWVNRLMAIRNGVARRLGLKDVGAMRGATAKPPAANPPPPIVRATGSGSSIYSP